MTDPAVRQVRDLLSQIDRIVMDLVKAQAFPEKPAAPSNRKKLGKQEVKSIRDLKRIGCSNKDIANVFDVNPATISRIVRGQYHR